MHKLFLPPRIARWMAILLILAIAALACQSQNEPVARRTGTIQDNPPASNTPPVFQGSSIPSLTVAGTAIVSTPIPGEINQTPTPAPSTLDALSITPHITAVPSTFPLITPIQITPSGINPDVSPTPFIPLPDFDLPIHGIQLGNLGSLREVQLAVAGGRAWTRFDYFQWDAIEPIRTDPPTYLWSNVRESALAQAAAEGIEIIGLVQFAPTWAQKYLGRACGPIAESELQRFGQFLAAAVSRYSQPPYNIRFWELGNEPDVDFNLVSGRSAFGCWGEVGALFFGGEYYASMLKTVYPLIKAADPQAQILVGGLLLDCNPDNPPSVPGNPGQLKDCSAGRFLQGILAAGGGDYFDGISFHAYDYYPASNQLGHFSNGAWFSAWNGSGPTLVAKVDFIRDLLRAYSHLEKYLLNTEVALLCGSSGDESYCYKDEFANTKAYYAAQSLATAKAEGLVANVWYSLTGWRASGLVTTSLRPEPAYNAFLFGADMLKESVFTHVLDIEAGVKGYEFIKGDQRLWIIWSIDEQEHRINNPSQSLETWDVFGNALPVGGELVVGIAPVYVTWSP